MGNKRMRQMIYGTVMVLFLGLIAYPSTAKADITYGVKNGFKKTVSCSAVDRENGYFLSASNIPAKAKKVKISLSKKSVGKVKSYGGGDFVFYPKKAGKTKITITAVVKGKKVKCKGTINVVKFKQPFKSLKVDGKDYSNNIKGSEGSAVEVKSNKSKAKVELNLKSGWKVSKVYKGEKKMKNRKSFTLKKGDGIGVYVKNKKNNMEVNLYVYFSE